MDRLFILGALDLDGPGEEARRAAVIRRPSFVALLAYLALAPRPFSRRDTVQALFWPEHDYDRARHALNQTLYSLRRSLGEGHVVSRGQTDIGIDADHLWCDGRAFLEAIGEGRPAEALGLYRGELLPGFHLDQAPAFERWLEESRARLRRAAGNAAWEAAMASSTGEEPRLAVRYARRAAHLTGDEMTLRSCVRLLDEMGDRAAALQVYHDFRERLETDLGVAPSPETQRLVREIQGRTEPHGPAGHPPRGSASADD